MFNRALNKLKKKVKRLFGNGFVLKKDAGSSFVKGAGVEIIDTKIVLTANSKLIIDDHVRLEGYDIHINNGSVEVGKYTRLIKDRQSLRPIISINNGKLAIGAYNVIKAYLKIRFGGICTIGTYNAINEGTEIRCDQSVIIGDYNMISYECMIYDTNTHCIYPPEIRRERTRADFPAMGVETEKPRAKEVFIGNDNWLAKRSVILKGCTLGSQVIVGTNAVASNIKIDGGILAGNPAYPINKK